MLVTTLLMDQLAVHEDAKGLRTKACQEVGKSVLNGNMMFFGMAHRELVAIDARHKFVGPGEVRKGRQGVPLGNNLTASHNAEAASKRIAVDLDPRWVLAWDVDGKVHAINAGGTTVFGASTENPLALSDRDWVLATGQRA